MDFGTIGPVGSDKPTYRAALVLPGLLRGTVSDTARVTRLGFSSESMLRIVPELREEYEAGRDEEGLEIHAAPPGALRTMSMRTAADNRCCPVLCGKRPPGFPMGMPQLCRCACLAVARVPAQAVADPSTGALDPRGAGGAGSPIPLPRQGAAGFALPTRHSRAQAHCCRLPRLRGLTGPVPRLPRGPWPFRSKGSRTPAAGPT